MKQLRRLELVLLVTMLILVHAASPAYADGAYADGTNAAENFANSLLDYFGY